MVKKYPNLERGESASKTGRTHIPLRLYYDHRDASGKTGCYYNVNTPKTEAGKRQVPMLDFVMAD